ncbi:MAG: hypothetical protein II913_00635 [Elusimicrobiaceae bacterium]|nr:hypothetical protein [Elusimicrobiaceae bacterium]
MARTIGHISRDPHTKGLNTNDNPLKYSNTFGAFAAYTGYDSSFFPTMRLTDTNSGNNISIDYRYHGCWDQFRTNVHMDQQVGTAMNGDNVNLGGALGKCGTTNNSYSGADKECSGFHYGHYNWNHYVQHDLQKGATCAGDRTGKACLQDDRDPYEKVLDASIWGANGARFPLQALSYKKGSPIFSRNWGKQFQRQYRNGTIDSYNRTKYHDAYKAIFHSNDVSCGYDADDTMNVNDALRYVDSLCANGMERKPSNGGEITCDHYYLADHE